MGLKLGAVPFSSLSELLGVVKMFKIRNYVFCLFSSSTRVSWYLIKSIGKKYTSDEPYLVLFASARGLLGRYQTTQSVDSRNLGALSAKDPAEGFSCGWCVKFSESTKEDQMLTSEVALRINAGNGPLLASHHHVHPYSSKCRALILPVPGFKNFKEMRYPNYLFDCPF